MQSWSKSYQGFFVVIDKLILKFCGKANEPFQVQKILKEKKLRVHATQF